MKKILVTWLDLSDIEQASPASGPLATALNEGEFDGLEILCHHQAKAKKVYAKQLEQLWKGKLEVTQVDLKSHTDFHEIYRAAKTNLDRIQKKHQGVRLTFLLSPDDSDETTIEEYANRETGLQDWAWLMLAKEDGLSSTLTAPLSEDTDGSGKWKLFHTAFGNLEPRHAQDVIWEKNVIWENLADMVTSWVNFDQRKENPIDQNFDKIIGKSDKVLSAKREAQKFARTDAPVLIYGESGTGKELFANAMHKVSSRKDKAIKTINCGALPEGEMGTSALFGHEVGAFTGATNRHIGLLEAADDGTVFLDEVGELSLLNQVKLLRVLAEGKILRLGATGEKDVDVRIIAATHKNLLEMVNQGTFREDLYYRLQDLILEIPPLRKRQDDREDDREELIDHFLKIGNDRLKQVAKKIMSNIQTEDPSANDGQARETEFYHPLELTPKVKEFLINQPWKGNVRELKSMINRLCVTYDQNPREPTVEQVKRTLSKGRYEGRQPILGRAIGGDFNLDSLTKKVLRHYIKRAKDQAPNETRAGKLLGYEDPAKYRRRKKTCGE